MQKLRLKPGTQYQMQVSCVLFSFTVPNAHHHFFASEVWMNMVPYISRWFECKCLIWLGPSILPHEKGKSLIGTVSVPRILKQNTCWVDSWRSPLKRWMRNTSCLVIGYRFLMSKYIPAIILFYYSAQWLKWYRNLWHQKELQIVQGSGVLYAHRLW